MQTKSPSKLSALFSGTQDKCVACNKTVYPLEKVTMGEESFHKSCFKCAHGGCPLTHSSYAALDGILYCKHHFQQLFMVKGNYQHVLNSATHKKNASADAEAMADTLAGKSDTEAATAAPEEKTLDAENGPEEKKAEE
ncbi:actin or actin-binding cytoskeletal protein [Lithospermum erythrorhizon]|uniref:Actin or actin-binding cytoskeletal protein n=1 Tax=Lithospermum erythrorhizon TaxID=34254 RepID=A0AAV3R5S5_LITER